METNNVHNKLFKNTQGYCQPTKVKVLESKIIHTMKTIFTPKRFKISFRPTY